MAYPNVRQGGTLIFSPSKWLQSHLGGLGHFGYFGFGLNHSPPPPPPRKMMVKPSEMWSKIVGKKGKLYRKVVLETVKRNDSFLAQIVTDMYLMADKTLLST